MLEHLRAKNVLHKQCVNSRSLEPVHLTQCAEGQGSSHHCMSNRAQDEHD